MKKHKRAISVLIAICMIAAVMTGCSGSGTSSSPAGTAKPSPAAKTPVYGGTLIVSQSTQQFEDNLYPPTAANADVLQNARPCLEPLFKIASDGTLIPFLVKEYKMENNGQKYTFILQQGVKFHDGTDFNAEAVKWNIEQTQAGKIQTVFNTVKSIDIIDNYTLVLNMASPDLFLLQTVATSLPVFMVSPTAVKTNGAEWAKTHPVGTGPFKLQSWDYGVKMVFVKNENYWGKDENGNKLPYLDGITFKFIPENVTCTTAFKNGEIDVLRALTSTMITNLKSSSKVTIYDYAFLQLNIWYPTLVSGSKFQNLKVRQAISYAIDMPTVIKSLFGAEFDTTNQVSYQGSPMYSKDITGYKYDPQKAKQLLAEAGYPNGFDATIVAENTPENSLLCQTIQSYFKAVGINLTIDLADAARFAQSVMFSSWGDRLAVIPFTYTPDEIGAARRVLNPATTLFKSTVDFPEKYKGQVNSLFAATTVDSAKKAYADMNKFLIDEACLLTPIYVKKYAVAQQSWVHGFGSGADGEKQIRYWSPETVWKEKR